VHIAVADPEIWNGEGRLPLPCTPFPLPLLHPFFSLPLEVGPLNLAKGSGERCKLPRQAEPF